MNYLEETLEFVARQVDDEPTFEDEQEEWEDKLHSELHPSYYEDDGEEVWEDKLESEQLQRYQRNVFGRHMI